MAYTASKVIAIAEAEVGYLEKKSNSQLDSKTANAGNKNYTKYARDLAAAGYYNGNKQGVAWCDVFVDWCHYMASVKDEDVAQNTICQTGPYGAGCLYSMRYYKAANRFVTKNPQPGDQIFFGKSQNSVSHTGIVYKVDDSKVYTIEGNTSGASGVVANGGGVFKKSYALNYKKIVGYGRPRYDAEEKTESKVESVKAKKAARHFLKTLSGTYTTTASKLNVRHGAGTLNALMVTIPKGTKVRCYGYYSISPTGYKWLYISFNYRGVTYQGFASSSYLKK
jgi:hypothetical protein